MMEQTTMRAWAGRWGWLIPIFLVISLFLNILGLILPFLEIDEAFHSKVTYSLPHSVHLMWEHKLYLVAVLILGFSIIFPFIKLASLFAAWFISWKTSSRATFLHWIELLGKWSYMDIFVVILLLSLTSQQSFISSTIHIGVYFFIGAITLSMVLSQIVLTMARKMIALESPPSAYSTKRIWMLTNKLYVGWTVPILTILAAGALVESLHAPFLRISQFLLVSRTYSISEIAAVMKSNQHIVLLIIMLGTLAFVPLLRLFILLVTWMSPMKIEYHIRVKKLLEGLSRWSMLDVFGLSLFLVATEGKDLIKTEILPGLRIVVVAIAISYLLGLVAVSLHKAMVNDDSATEAS